MKRKADIFVAGALIVGVAIAAAAAVVLVYGREETLRLIGGEADLGPISFDTVQQRWRWNDALVCPANRCASDSDKVAPIYPVPVLALRTAFGRVIGRERYVNLVDTDDLVPAERYVQRSELMRFPDTIAVRFYALPEGRATLALYSRSQFGLVDFGANRRRLERWLDRLERELTVMQADAR